MPGRQSASPLNPVDTRKAEGDSPATAGNLDASGGIYEERVVEPMAGGPGQLLTHLLHDRLLFHSDAAHVCP